MCDMQPDDGNLPAQPDATVSHKEKSVLQAKLTKLAIQIGYAGDNTFSLFCCTILL